MTAFGARGGAKRAVKLAALGMKPESLREWIYLIRGQDDDGLLVAAEFARSQKLYDRAINTAERTVARHDFALRYLMPYRDYFAAAARDNATDPAILLGIARQESRFSADIVSSAGAVGLMQLMPPTAHWVARQTGPHRLPADADRRHRHQHAVRRLLLQVLARPAGPPARARRRRLQCRAEAGAGVARRRAARGRDLGRDDPLQRNPRLREEGSCQHDVLRARS